MDEAGLKALGARGLVRPSERALQVVLGPIADQVASEIRSAMESGAAAPAAVAADAWLAALGGRDNLVGAERCDGRLRLTLKDAARADIAVLKQLGARAVALTPSGAHLILGPAAEALERTLVEPTG